MTVYYKNGQLFKLAVFINSNFSTILSLINYLAGTFYHQFRIKTPLLLLPAR